MTRNKKTGDPGYDISRLTFQEFEEKISRRPAIILPLGGCEPYAACGCLGAASACADTLAAAFAEKLKILRAPVLAFGCSTPYGAFGGTAGVKPRTLTNLLCEVIHRWHIQGVRTAIVIDCLFDNKGAAEKAFRRLENTCHGLNIVYFSFQRDERVRAFIGRQLKQKEPDRTEYGILSLAAFIDRTLVRSAQKKHAAAVVDVSPYLTWRRRGADPQQFRKLFPGGSVSSAENGFDLRFGRKLLDFSVTVLMEAAKPFMEPRHQAD